jgi:hypothetical protein
MRHLDQFFRRFLAVTVLMLALTCPAFADDGWMQTGLTPPPPPPHATGVMHPWATDTDTALDGWIQSGLAPTTEVALSLLQGLLSQF